MKVPKPCNSAHVLGRCSLAVSTQDNTVLVTKPVHLFVAAEFYRQILLFAHSAV